MTAPKWTYYRRRPAASVLASMGIISPSIDIDRVLAGLQVPVQEIQPEAFEKVGLPGKKAASFPKDGWVTFYVTADATLYERRTYLAKLLGHLLLHSNTRVWAYPMLEKSPQRTEASIYAADLLIPRDMLDKAVLRLKNPTIQNLTQLFKVPEEWIKTRVRRLNG
jgi:hypothetical protein